MRSFLNREDKVIFYLVLARSWGIYGEQNTQCDEGDRRVCSLPIHGVR